MFVICFMPGVSVSTWRLSVESGKGCSKSFGELERNCYGGNELACYVFNPKINCPNLAFFKAI